MNLYFDNAATSYPKPKEVVTSMTNYMNNIGSSPGRGAYKKSLASSRIVFECRQEIANFFNYENPNNVVFTGGITTSLNILLKSFLKDGDHIITTSMEHNSVLRPIFSLSSIKNVEYDIISANQDGFINTDDIIHSIKSNTIAIIVNHSSNIVGSIQNLKSIGQICKDNNILFIVDTAQSAGIIPINFKEINCSALAFTSHKGLLGPQGLGGFIISDDLNELCTTFIEGGTGSLSESIVQPDFLPDKFESGTLNTPAIYGLYEGIKFINKEGILTIKEKEEYLTSLFINGLQNTDGIILYGSSDTSKKTAVISITSNKFSNSELSYVLDKDYGIMTRTGLHCAPLAHKTIGSYPTGTTRFGIGYFQNEDDIKYTLNVLKKLHK
ncbi:aminotransferase class V-fold PLP-dependent enzyme [Clostridium sediminicola]|uniref:aminotransferase class V-fold PLP-dependent enzyme n=1 Tax=Clostridium sediminicola TaxID=3114879 RepID=UPI0031F2722A